ncbi:family 1 glycosylhydrolase [Mycobacterium sp. MBM]|nr:family 1 glycosylhydrolase [Mycobacterium sp. MBM]
MRSGRVAGVAVVVGIWSATGWGYPVASAETPDSGQGTQQSSQQGASEPEPAAKPAGQKPERRVAPRTVRQAQTAARGGLSAVRPNGTTAHPPEADEVDDVTVGDISRSENTDTVHAPSAPAQTQLTTPVAAAVSPAAATAPAPVTWTSTLPNPVTAIRYVVNLARSLVGAVLSPFAAGLPAGPVGPPSAWAVLAWVRRELFNATPRIVDDGETTQTSTGQVLGNVGASDPDGDPLRYTVVGRPLNGGTVQIDQTTGDFIYRPTNAMAATGGTDAFTVVVDDQRAGVHWHGPLGFLQHIPILGNLLRPGGGHGVARTITVEVDPVEDVDLSFPDDFHWGVAHAGFQAEGGPGSPVDPNSDWYAWVHHPLNQLLGLTNGVPENGPGTYVSYDSDAALAKNELGMNTFRMSIEWSRIFPNSTAGIDITDEGGGVSLADLQALQALADPVEVAHYRAVFDALRAHGLEPLVTVNHFTLPLWVHDPITARPLIQLGLPAPAAGWLSDQTPVEFEKYAAFLAWTYGDQVDNWVTLNEPFPPVMTEFLAIPGLVPSWPPGVVRTDLAARFVGNEAKGHVAAYDAIHRWDDDAFVGFANNMVPARPANPLNPQDVAAADAWNKVFNQWFPNAVIDGWVDANFDGKKTADEIRPGFADKVDFLGVQYYGSQPMGGFGFAPLPGFNFLQGIPFRCQASEQTCSDFNQPIDPGGFREVLEVAASYGKPVWITENGVADDEDTKRPSYIVNHIAVVQDLVAHGTDIRGYTYWSFVDNLEWADGYHLQFGLYGSDPNTPELERTPKPASIAAISQITGANALPADLLGLYLPGARTAPA